MSSEVLSHVTGTVWKVMVAIGDRVQAGEELVIMESMKMEIPVEAEAAGTVTAIHCAEGDAVDEGASVVTVE